MKIKTILTTAVLTAIMSVNTLAAGINVYLDDELVTFSDAQPKIINDRTMVPVRGLFEKMGYKVEWNDYSRIATFRGPEYTISAGEDVLMANVTNSNKEVVISQETMPVISENRLYLPLRSISQATGKIVDWDQDTKSVIITSPENIEADDTPDGYMSGAAEEYLRTVFADISAIKQLVIESKDPVLYKLYKLDTNLTKPYVTDYSQIYEYTHKLYELEAPKGLSSVKTSIERYVGTIESACRLGLDNAEIDEENYDADALIAELNRLADEKYQISTESFAVNLVKYFNDNKVAFESIFGDTCLDVMN